MSTSRVYKVGISAPTEDRRHSLRLQLARLGVPRGVLEIASHLVLFAAVVWITHFWNFSSFGLYEDDYYSIPDVMGSKLPGMLESLATSSVTYTEQGRPLHHLLIAAFSGLGFRLGGLEGIYVVAFAIVLGNVLLFYCLLRRLSRRTELALLGALAFCLFPADTTQAFLTHALGLQPALTLLLVAFHLYLSRSVKSSYVVIFLSLFLYETVFPVFAAAPLLRSPWSPGRKRELYRHTTIMGIMLVLVVAARSLLGEGRIARFGALQGVLLLANPVLGPLTAVAMYVYRPIETLIRLDRATATLAVIVLISIAALLYCTRPQSRQEQPEDVAEDNRLPRLIQRLFGEAGGLFVAGAIMLVLAYPLTLTTVGFAVSGRGTRVHTAAVVGGACLVACLGSAILRLATTRASRRIAYAALASWFALLAGFGVRVQHDYIAAWNFQRSFWSAVVKLCPDLDDGTVIFVDPSGLPDNRQLLFLRKQPEGVPDSRQIRFLTYTDLPLRQIFQFPASWKHPPVVYRLPMDWRSSSLDISSAPMIDEDTADDMQRSLQTVQSGKAILLETAGGRLTRRTGSVAIMGRQVTLKPACCSSTTTFPPGPLYLLLIGKTDSSE